MTLDELRALWAASAPTDWNLIESLGDQIGEHGLRAIYKPDLLIEARWGIEHNERFDEAWVGDTFADASKSSHYLDLYFAGSVVDREVYVQICTDQPTCRP